MAKQNLLGTESLAEKMKKVKEGLASTAIPEEINEINLVKTKPVKKIPPKLFVSGRLDRKKRKYTVRSLVLLESINNEIKAYCKGGELAILNYLIKEGLESVKRAESPINVEMIEIEDGVLV